MKRFTFLLSLLLLLSAAWVDGLSDEEDAGVTVEDESDEDEIGPADYQHPFVDRSSHHFIEMFDDTKRAEDVWVKSEARKDDVDEDLAKYDGRWKIHVPDSAALKGDAVLNLLDKVRFDLLSFSTHCNFRQDITQSARLSYGLSNSTAGRSLCNTMCAILMDRTAAAVM